MIAFDYVKPSSQKAALDAMAKNASAQFIAGGTNLIDLMKKGITAPQKIIDINNLPLKSITKFNTSLHIGALALNSEVAANDMVKAKYPLLSQALHAGASAQLRNMATVGGNMMQRTRCTYFYDITMPCNKRNPGSGCGAIQGYNRMHAIFGASDKCIAVHPSDMCIALSALDATVIVASSKSERTIPFGEFHRLPGDNPGKDNMLQKGEMITGVTIPENNLNDHSYYLKVRDRASYAFALVSVAAALEIDGRKIKDVRLAMGGVAHKPWRLVESENYLKGKDISPANFQQAAEIAMKGGKGYGYNNFKIRLAPVTIVEALSKAAG